MFSPLACNVCPVLDFFFFFFLAGTYLTGHALAQKADLCAVHLMLIFAFAAVYFWAQSWEMRAGDLFVWWLWSFLTCCHYPARGTMPPASKSWIGGVLNGQKKKKSKIKILAWNTNRG